MPSRLLEALARPARGVWRGWLDHPHRRVRAALVAMLVAAGAVIGWPLWASDPPDAVGVSAAASARPDADATRQRALAGLALLLLLGAAIGAPTVLAVRRQTQVLARRGVAAAHTRHAMAVTDGHGHLRWTNPAFDQLLPADAAANPPTPGTERTGAAQGDLVDALRRLGADDGALQRLRDALHAGQGLACELGLPDAHGQARCLKLDLQPDPGGDEPGFIVVLTDASEQAAQRRRADALLRAMPNGVAIRSASGRVLDCNPAAQRLLLLNRDQLLGLAPSPAGWRPTHADGRTMAPHEHPALLAMATGRSVQGMTIGIHGACGTQRWLLVDVALMRDAAGQVSGSVACLTDVTDDRNRQAVLRHTVEAAGLGTWTWDLRDGAMHFNDRLLAMLGFRRGDLAETAEAWSALVHPDDRRAWQVALRAHLADPALPCRSELRVRRPDGGWATVLSCGVVIERDGAGRPLSLAGINIDMTEQTQMQAMLRHAARTDGLTQLPNRAAVFEHVQQVIDRAAQAPGGGDYAVLFMDCDRFKQVNDTLGHGAGDELLRQIAQRLRATLRAGDAIGLPVAGFSEAGPVVSAGHHAAGRIGGDEFVVVLENAHGRDGACGVARRLIEELSQPYQIAGTRVHSTASIGIVLSGQGASDAATVMRDADTAMYEAKRLGRGRSVVFDASMHERVARGVAIEADLRLALARDELFVVYQPVIELQQPGAGGIEALVRWRHPQRGLVPPLHFIGIAEECGLIVDIGNLVLDTACRQFIAWQRALGPLAPTSVAVNLSPAQLRWPGLLDEIQRCLQRSGIAPQALQLEVTESLAAQDDAARAKLREIKALGVRIALDDFGTGYSSLACLHQLPVDTVKIDRSFVMHAETSDYHRVLIEATIRVARTLGMGTVAEGIESDGQAALMHRLQCDRGQGYLFSRPQEADALTTWFASREPDVVRAMA